MCLRIHYRLRNAIIKLYQVSTTSLMLFRNTLCKLTDIIIMIVTNITTLNTCKHVTAINTENMLALRLHEAVLLNTTSLNFNFNVESYDVHQYREHHNAPFVNNIITY